MKPLISTITPCYKMKPYLKRFLEELPLQTYFDNLEIVIDHNEPDAEELVWIEEFQEKYPGKIKHIITNPVEPIGTSMNRCIRESSGELLTIWNVDDLRTPKSIELQVDAFTKGDADIVYGNFLTVRSFGSQQGKLMDFARYDSKPEEFTRSMLLGPFMAFRKSLCEKAGYFDEQLQSGADFDLAVRLAFHGNPVMTKGLLGYYLNEGKGASTRPDSKQPLERTVIELRYSIYDKLDYDYVVPSLSYDIKNIFYANEKIHVSSYIPNYDQFLNRQSKSLLKLGLMNYSLRKIFMPKTIRALIRRSVRRMI